MNNSKEPTNRSIDDMLRDIRNDAQLMQESVNLLDVWCESQEMVFSSYPKIFLSYKKCATQTSIITAGRLFGSSGVTLNKLSKFGFNISSSNSCNIKLLYEFYNEKIILWRNKIIAHRDPKISDILAADESNLTPSELISFSRDTANLVNRIINDNASEQYKKHMRYNPYVELSMHAVRNQLQYFIQKVSN